MLGRASSCPGVFCECEAASLQGAEGAHQCGSQTFLENDGEHWEQIVEFADFYWRHLMYGVQHIKEFFCWWCTQLGIESIHRAVVSSMNWDTVTCDSLIIVLLQYHLLGSAASVVLCVVAQLVYACIFACTLWSFCLQLSQDGRRGSS